MKEIVLCLLISAIGVIITGCDNSEQTSRQPIHHDEPFVQDFSTKYLLEDSVRLLRVYSDRNGNIEISTSDNLYKLHAGEFLFSGSLVQHRYYRPIADKNVGDRKINSLNIVAMLQTAYHFTRKEIYKAKAFELMTQHGYFENLMGPCVRLDQRLGILTTGAKCCRSHGITPMTKCISLAIGDYTVMPSMTP